MVPEAGTAFGTVLGIVVCAMLLAFPAYRLVSLYVEREITALEFLIASLVLLSFTGGIFVLWYSPFKWLLAAMLIVLCVVVVALDRRGQRRLAAKLLQEDIDKCYRLLSFDPRNVGAHSRLGDLFLQQGHLDHAITCYQSAVALAPQDAKEKAKLQRAIETKQRTMAAGTECPRCGTLNVPRAPHCAQCRFPISARHDLLNALRTKETLQYSQAGAVTCLAVLVVALAFQIISGHVSVALVVVTFCFLFVCALLFFVTRIESHE